MLQKKNSTHDVFVSYSHVDEEKVRRLISRLIAQGLDVWYAPQRILGGMQIVPAIEEGVQSSRAVIVVLSSSSVDSWWVNAEWQMRFRQISEDRTLKIIPVKLEDCKVPEILKIFHILDFHDVDFNDRPRFENKVQELTNCIRGLLPSTSATVVGLPFVIITMNRRQAEELASNMLQGIDQLDQLNNILTQLWPQNFTGCYEGMPEDWIPFIDGQKNIREIIENIIDFINNSQLNSSEYLIQPIYCSSDFLSSNPILREDTWAYLVQAGCILIVDAISMFHPEIQQLLLKSTVGSNKNSAVVVITPISSHFIEINQMIENVMRDKLPMVFRRYDNFDLECALEIGDNRALNRWLLTILPQSIEAIKKQSASSEMKTRFRNTFGSEVKSNRVYSLIFSKESSEL